MTAALLAQVDGWLRRLELGDGGMVVAVSGGPDSVALLRLLQRLPSRSLIVAHLNHQLRGAESNADEDFVRSLRGNQNGEWLVRCDRVDVAAVATAAGKNLEAVARRVRYEWLVRVARDTGARWVATGHTADDQAETILHRLLRGAGLKGLRGIAPRRELAPGIDLVRPLLPVTRSRIVAFLEQIGQPYRTDSSNADVRFSRNRIRHELLPLLARDYNSGIVSALCRLAEQADAAYREEAAQAERLLREAELPSAGRLLIFDRNPLAAASRGLLREAFRLVWEREDWPLDAMNFAAWDRVAAVALGEMPAVDFPDGVTARVGEYTLQIGRSTNVR
jgi:tRNA(Ile)-lysidine synthase